jgi:hypothetical protein
MIEPSVEQIREDFSSDAHPPREKVARLAYELWEERGHRPDSEEDDWLEAERRLNSDASN